MHPPDQRLDGGDLAGGQFDDRLVMHPKLPLGDGHAQLGAHLQAFLGGVVHLRPEHLDVPAATGLGGVHRRVGVTEQQIGRLPALAETHPDARPGPDGPVADGERSLQFGQRPVRDAQGVFLGRPRHQDGELVTAQPRHGVGVAHHVGQPLGHLHQHAVAGAVAEPVIDGLELVQIQQQHAGWPFAAFGSDDRLADPVGQQGPVGQPGQRVVQRQPFHVPPGLVQVGGPLGDPVLERLVHQVEFFGEQVDAGDHGVHRIPGIGGRQPGAQIPGRQLDDQIDQLVQPFVVECFRHSPPPVVTRCWLARSVAASIA